METPVRFLTKVFCMVSTPANRKFVAWDADGLYFTVLRPELSAAVLPKYFQFHTFEDFSANLVEYGFLRLGRFDFFHPLFRRNKAPMISRLADRVARKRRASEMLDENDEQCEMDEMVSMANEVAALSCRRTALGSRVAGLKASQSSLASALSAEAAKSRRLKVAVADASAEDAALERDLWALMSVMASQVTGGAKRRLPRIAPCRWRLRKRVCAIARRRWLRRRWPAATMTVTRWYRARSVVPPEDDNETNMPPGGSVCYC